MKLKLALLLSDLTNIWMGLTLAFVAYSIHPFLGYGLAGAYVINRVTEFYIQKELVKSYQTNLNDMLAQYSVPPSQNVDEMNDRRGRLDN